MKQHPGLVSFQLSQIFSATCGDEFHHLKQQCSPTCQYTGWAEPGLLGRQVVEAALYEVVVNILAASR